MPAAATRSTQPRIFFTSSSTPPLLIREIAYAPANAAGTLPTESQRTSRQLTVPCRTCTPPPIGLRITDATTSEEIAAVGTMWKKITSTGVISAAAHAGETDDEADQQRSARDVPMHRVLPPIARVAPLSTFVYRSLSTK